VRSNGLSFRKARPNAIVANLDELKRVPAPLSRGSARVSDDLADVTFGEVGESLLHLRIGPLCELCSFASFA